MFNNAYLLIILILLFSNNGDINGTGTGFGCCPLVFLLVGLLSCNGCGCNNFNSNVQ